jgi:hypothetical protein
MLRTITPYGPLRDRLKQIFTMGLPPQQVLLTRNAYGWTAGLQDPDGAVVNRGHGPTRAEALRCLADDLDV